MSYHGLTMEPESKTKWLAGLRSGKYTQGHKALKTVLYGKTCLLCCLGVWGVIEGVRQLPIDDTVNKDSVSITFEWDDGSFDSSQLSNKWFASFFEFTGDSVDKSAAVAALQGKLMLMNDGVPEEGGRKYSFDEIADWIESNL